MRLFAAIAALGVIAFSAQAQDRAAILDTYAEIALVGYEDSLQSARALQEAVAALLDQPTEQSLKAAREAWLAARRPYLQTEAYRFGNAVVDEWEGRVNAWPLDEGLIDYVDAGYGAGSDDNAFYAVNIIANDRVTAGGRSIEASEITPELIRSLHELGGIEANVAGGYHAIEFLLWGQDLNGTGPGAGERPHTDFDPERCTGGHCGRRAQYLAAASSLLVTDLAEMVADWREGGPARAALTAGEESRGIAAMLTGLGSLSYGELAGERMKLGLMLGDPEEEQDCFSDNTHNSHYYDVLGIDNVYHGRYRRTDGRLVEGPSLAALVRAADPLLADEMEARLAASLAAAEALKRRGEAVEAYDQMIAAGNAEGNAVIETVIDALVAQTRSLERVIAALHLDGVAIAGSDSLDDPNAVFQ